MSQTGCFVLTMLKLQQTSCYTFWKHCHIKVKDGLVSMVMVSSEAESKMIKRVKKGVLTAEFPHGSGQPVSRARSTRQAIDWLHWSQLLEVSAEAFVRTHTHPQTDRTALTLFLT